MTIDNLAAADVILADGSFVTASEDTNEHLFWALRGGGGNFGVVTSFTFRLHPVHTVIAGPMLWHLAHAADAMRMFDGLIAAAPDRLNGIFAFLVVPPGPPFPEELHGKNMCGVVWCHTDSADEAEQDLAPARAFGPPALDLVGPLPHPVMQSAFDGIAPWGLQNYWRGDFIAELSDESIALHVERGSEVPNMHSGIFVYRIDGVAGRVAQDETAWSYRDVLWAEVVFSDDPDPAKADELRSWVRRALARTAPALRGRCVHQLPRGRGTGPGEGGIPRELRPSRGDHGALRQSW